MSNDIQHKDLWKRLNNVTAKDWQKAGERLDGVIVLKGAGKGSHCVFHDANNSSLENINFHIATIIKKTYKQANQSVFKHLLDYGFDEEDIWRALKMLK